MKNYKANEVVNILLGLSVFFIPVWPLLPPFFWGIAFAYWLIGNKFKALFKLPPKSYLILFISFYIIYALGLLWSSDISSGMRDLSIKVPMLLFPLFFSISTIDEGTVRWVKDGFVWGSLLACLICIGGATIHYLDSHDVGEFFYTRLSFIMFPAYFAMCLNLAVLFLMKDLFADKSVIHKKLLALKILFLIIFIILLNEKMALIGAIITIPFYYISEARKRNLLKHLLMKLTGFSIICVTILFFYFRSTNRFEQIPQAIEAFKSENGGHKPDSYYNSSMMRLTLWKYGWIMFKNNWLFGVGTGDIESEELKLVKADDFQYGIRHPETPPGQYIHVAVILGVFGLIFLLGIYFIPLYFSVKYKDYLYAAFLLIYIINSITGTVLSASSVLLYGFFNSFLFVLFEQNVKGKPYHSPSLQ